MPEPTNIARAVLNSSNGRWYKFEREGDRLKALDADGLILRPAGSGANAIDVYRVTDERGDFKAMVATAEKPATLKVWAKDPESDNLSLVETISCTAFADNRCRFVLAADYSAYGNRAARLDFIDGTAGTITATYDDCTLYEFQNSYQERPGSYRVLAAAVENLDDKRVIFESDDPSVCRIERGSNASAYMRVAEAPQQTDQYCVLIGVGKGTCNVTCRSVADPSLEDVVAVTVITHPEDVPKVIGGDLAAELSEKIAGLMVGISMGTIGLGGPDEGGANLIDERQVVVPGEVEDLFKLTINCAGTVPKGCQGNGVGPSVCLFIAFRGGLRAGDTPPVMTAPGEAGGMQALEVALLGYDGAIVLNTQGQNTPNTETLNANKIFFVRGGDTISFGWAKVSIYAQQIQFGLTRGTATGEYTCEFNATAVTHYPQQDA